MDNIDHRIKLFNHLSEFISSKFIPILGDPVIPRSKAFEIISIVFKSCHETLEIVDTYCNIGSKITELRDVLVSVENSSFTSETKLFDYLAKQGHYHPPLEIPLDTQIRAIQESDRTRFIETKYSMQVRVFRIIVFF